RGYSGYDCGAGSCRRSLIRAASKIHHTGSMWKAVRASISIPAALPPLIQEGDLYVDGAVLNNLPTDVMRQFCDGYVIASDTSVEMEQMALGRPDYDHLSGWSLLLNKLNPFSRLESMPSLVHVFMRAFEMRSVEGTDTRKEQADIYLRPPVEWMGRFAWDTIEDFAEVGYRYAMKEIEGWENDEVKNIVLTEGKGHG
ncbi:MAG: patatin-like phospholipase family protein, partial [Candidatus Latescibacteria bacterium]|nr:patatin-like phospholipase family protein [Candidatus Latescibacterota bacterium]